MIYLLLLLLSYLYGGTHVLAQHGDAVCVSQQSVSAGVYTRRRRQLYLLIPVLYL